MAKDVDSLVDCIRTAMIKLDELDMFDSNKKAHEDLAEVCGEYLVHCGYKVIRAATASTTITKLDDLIARFYVLLESYMGTEQLTYRDSMRDRVTARNFIKARMDTGLNKKSALAECMLIIETFFNNIDKYHLTGDINFGLFDQGKTAWVTAMTVQLINKKYKGKLNDEFEAKLAKASELDEDDENKWLMMEDD